MLFEKARRHVEATSSLPGSILTHQLEDDKMYIFVFHVQAIIWLRTGSYFTVRVFYRAHPTTMMFLLKVCLNCIKVFILFKLFSHFRVNQRVCSDSVETAKRSGGLSHQQRPNSSSGVDGKAQKSCILQFFFKKQSWIFIQP